MSMEDISWVGYLLACERYCYLFATPNGSLFPMPFTLYKIREWSFLLTVHIFALAEKKATKWTIAEIYVSIWAVSSTLQDVNVKSHLPCESVHITYEKINFEKEIVIYCQNQSQNQLLSFLHSFSGCIIFLFLSLDNYYSISKVITKSW